MPPGEPTEHRDLVPGIYSPEQTSGLRAKLARDLKPEEVVRRPDNTGVRLRVADVRVWVRYETGLEELLMPGGTVFVEVGT